ncbi:HU family DNA-binding protein [Paenibacillus alvei]|uniref:HU family DNA-binding protein n=1 Tax=Paenibacillus alvei TaxID=44250 RepID=UPI000288C68B|nr:HU family DNA-binding protein [Paenibacillus alvei]EJW14037.1 bacterial nucleoid DNA-binding protein [Paenibacillus alvei DSM 29]MCY9545303.1 HU family DNA-binding protein [Paenibacillus alvei]MCY9707610.1 HU family DNA-binding protein [Paenibacillus alvei]MCY9758353.1 HU family DNA-binding protein [Paenibacillus alvei]MEC0082878.1 HU family DNA-binding protein [Paenibacillus alvei]
MTKDQFIRSYAEKQGISIKAAREQVNGVFDHVLEVVPTLQDGEKLDITGIVSFKVKDVSARTVRNPKTGEEVQKGKTRKVNASVKATLKNAVKA